MLLQLNGIGDQKISYRDHTNIQFDSLDQYILLAKKSISKFANKFYQGLATKMLKDEDAVSNIANAIMMADWRWDDDYKNAQGTKKNKYAYRNQCAIWAIKTYVTKLYKRSKYINNVYSLDFVSDEESSSASSYIVDNKQITPDQILQEKEDKENLEYLINTLFSLECLTARQKDYIRLYYFEDHTFEQIGKRYGITREAVRQGLNKAITLLKNNI